VRNGEVEPIEAAKALSVRERTVFVLCGERRRLAARRRRTARLPIISAIFHGGRGGIDLTIVFGAGADPAFPYLEVGSI
jgi:hypothetical protein